MCEISNLLQIRPNFTKFCASWANPLYLRPHFCATTQWVEVLFTPLAILPPYMGAISEISHTRPSQVVVQSW